MPDVRHGVARRAVLFAPGDLRAVRFHAAAPGPRRAFVARQMRAQLRHRSQDLSPRPSDVASAHAVRSRVCRRGGRSGRGRDPFKAGDELMAAPTAPCEKCFFCLRGQENLCPQAMEKMVMGAYADFLLLPAHVVARNAFRKPPALAFEEAALLEPLSCVVHAQALARPEAAESVLIVGAGAFGLLHMLALARRGARGRGRGTRRESPGMGGTARRRPRDRCRHGRSRRPKLRGSTAASALTW